MSGGNFAWTWFRQETGAVPSRCRLVRLSRTSISELRSRKQVALVGNSEGPLPEQAAIAHFVTRMGNANVTDIVLDALSKEGGVGVSENAALRQGFPGALGWSASRRYSKDAQNSRIRPSAQGPIMGPSSSRCCCMRLPTSRSSIRQGPYRRRAMTLGHRRAALACSAFTMHASRRS